MDSLADALVAGKYRVLRALGRGSLGTVYLCRETSEGQLMTLKLPYPQLMASEVFRTQFWLEIAEAARLHGPNVVPILEFGDDLELGAYYLAMPYVAHPDLATVLRENGPLPDERSAEIAMQVLEALSAAHAVNVVHLNLKPSNVFVQTASEGANHTLVADFGCARLTPGGTWPAPRPIPAAMIGTPEYASPEHARGWALDARSDIYGVGVMLYEMLAGRRPFEAPSAFDVARMHCGAPPPPPSGFRRTDPELESVCLKALSKTPDARYQSAAEMRDVLASVHKRLARGKRRVAVSSAPKVQHDSLAPFERAAPEMPVTIPKRRAALAWVAVVGLAGAGWAGYGALTQVQRSLVKAASVSRGIPAASQPPLELLIPDEQTGPALEAPAPEAPAGGDVEPADSAEPPQLVAIQAPAEAPPSAAVLSQPTPSKLKGNVALGAAWPRAQTSEAFRSALDLAAITECYRKGLALPGVAAQPFSARLDLETGIDGRVHWAKLRAPQLPPVARRCVEHAALTARVSDPERVTLEASVLVEFSP